MLFDFLSNRNLLRLEKCQHQLTFSANSEVLHAVKPFSYWDLGILVQPSDKGLQGFHIDAPRLDTVEQVLKHFWRDTLSLNLRHGRAYA